MQVKPLNSLIKKPERLQKFSSMLPYLEPANYTYAEASPSQKKEDFIASTENALHYFGGVPAAIVPDNLKSAVTKSNRYEPTINETFLDFAEHYETTILPARATNPGINHWLKGQSRYFIKGFILF